MGETDSWQVDDEVWLWLDPSGGITLKAVTAEGDPVELSSAQARELGGGAYRSRQPRRQRVARQGAFWNTRP